MKSMFLIYADTGVGKTTVAETAPGPRLYLAADAGSHGLPSVVSIWKPGQDLPELTEDDTVVCQITNHGEWQDALKWLQANNCGPFNTLIVDTYDELQDLFIEKVFKFGTVETWEQEAKGKDARQSWGALYSFLKHDLNILRSFKANDLANIILLSQVDDENLPHVPHVKGSILKAILRASDFLCYLRVEKQSGSYVRVLDMTLESGSKGKAKTRYGALADVLNGTKTPGRISRPNLSKIIDLYIKTKENN